MSYVPDPGRSPQIRGNALLSGNALAVASTLTWAAGFPAAEMLLETWPPIALMVARIAMALSVLLPLWVLIDGFRAIRFARWGRALYVGGVGFGTGTYLILLAQWLTDPVTVALIAACTPIIATLIEVAYGERQLTRHFLLGLFTTVAGGLIATGSVSAPQLGLGVLCAVMSGALFAWGSHATVRDFPELSPTGRTTITFVGAFMMMNMLFVGHAFAGFDVLPKAPVNANQVAMLAIYAIGAMALSQILFIASVGKLGIALSAFHINLAPFYVMLMMLTLGAPWNWPQAIGALVVGVGVVMAQRR